MLGLSVRDRDRVRVRVRIRVRVRPSALHPGRVESNLIIAFR